MDEHGNLSRYEKNQDMYKDVYLNSKVVDFNNLKTIYDQEPEEDELSSNDDQTIEVNNDYKTKEYNFDEFLNKAHEERFNDNSNRSLDDTFIEKQNEIVELIQSIEQKEKDDDLFSDLLPDLEDETLVTDPVEDDEDTFTNDKLENTINESMLIKYSKSNEDDDDEKLDDSFEDIKESDSKEHIKIKTSKLPIIVFIITFLMLIGLIIYVVIKLK